MKNSAPKMSARDRISEIALQTKAPAFVIGLIKPE
jgi:lysozyme family protein